MAVRVNSVVGEGDALGRLRRRRGEAVPVRDGEGPLFLYGVKQVIEADPAGLRSPRGHGARAARRRGLWLQSFGVGEGVLARGGPRRHHVVLLLFHLYDHYCHYYHSQSYYYGANSCGHHFVHVARLTFSWPGASATVGRQLVL